MDNHNFGKVETLIYPEADSLVNNNSFTAIYNKVNLYVQKKSAISVNSKYIYPLVYYIIFAVCVKIQ